MSRESRRLATPRVEARLFAVGLTAQAGDPATLAELANDVGGRPSQRQTIVGVVSSSVWQTYWRPTPVAKFLRVTLAVVSGVFSTGNVKVSLDLADQSGHDVLAASDPEIPVGLRDDVPYFPGTSPTTPSRFGAAHVETVYLDVAALVAAGLDLSDDLWRFTWTLTVNSPSVIELLQVDEVPRFAVDDAEGFGQIPGASYLPRGIVRDGTPGGLQRLWETVRVGMVWGLRTYHQMARPEADPWTTSSTSFAPFGSDEEEAGVAAAYACRPRRMRGTTVDCRVRFALRYRIRDASGGDTAQVRLTTGAGAYTATLSDVSGDWADATLTAAYLDTGASGGVDLVRWTARVTNGSSALDLIFRDVVDYPEP